MAKIGSERKTNRPVVIDDGKVDRLLNVAALIGGSKSSQSLFSVIENFVEKDLKTIDKGLHRHYSDPVTGKMTNLSLSSLKRLLSNNTLSLSNNYLLDRLLDSFLQKYEEEIKTRISPSPPPKKPKPKDANINTVGSSEYSDDIEDFLRDNTNISDDWGAFFNPIRLIGREKELGFLVDFANAEKMVQNDHQYVLWSTIYGGHAVGKTRLALEWLNHLSLNGWVTGRLDLSMLKPESLIECKPEKKTAIVFDNIDIAGEELWTLMEGINTKWNDLQIPVRILLISHTIPIPLLGSFVRTQLLKSIKYEPDLFISPLSDEKDCLEILHTIAQQNDFVIPEEQAIRFVQDTEGRPAFLCLAGAYTEGWHHKLKDYATSIIAHAQMLFGNEGTDLLILSALAGPVSDELRKVVAPLTGNLHKLMELFAKPLSFITETIPRIEPELLANEIVIQGLGKSYSKASRKELLNKIIGILPEITLDRIKRIWKESLNATQDADLSGMLILYYSGEHNENTERFAVLEDMFEQVALHFHSSNITSAFNKLVSVRSSCFALALTHEHKSDNISYRTLVDKALHSSLPAEGLGNYLREIHQYLPCNYDNRLYWASMLDYLLGINLLSNLTKTGYTTLGNLTVNYFPNNHDELYQYIQKQLTSGNQIERVFCAIKIANWANQLKVEPEKILSDFRGIINNLYEMTKGHEVSEIIAAHYALRWIVKGPNEKVNPDRIGAFAIEIFSGQLNKFDFNALTFESVIRTIGVTLQTSYDFSDIFSWFNDKKRTQSTTLTKPATLLIKQLEVIFRRNDLSNNIRCEIAVTLLRIGKWNAAIEESIVRMLFNEATGIGLKREIIIRAFTNNKKNGTNFFARFFADKKISPHFIKQLLNHTFTTHDLELKYITLAGMRNIDILIDRNARTYNLPPKIGRINLLKFLSEISNPSNATKENTESELLLGLLKDIYISNRGHLIHRLKAKDTTERWAYYFVHVDPIFENSFLEAIKNDGTIDIENYGSIVASCYGEVPTQAVKDYLKERYGFDLDKKEE